MATVSSIIDKVHNKFDKNYSQLIARGPTVDDPISLFEAYLVVPCHSLKPYIRRQHKDYLDGKLTISRAVKHGTQDVCMVNKVRKYHSMCEMVESVHSTVETQRRVFCSVSRYSISKANGRSSV